jgi:hypothetical protein
MIKHRLEIQRNDEILIHAFKKRIIGIMGVDSCAMGVDAANKERLVIHISLDKGYGFIYFVERSDFLDLDAEGRASFFEMIKKDILNDGH